MVGTLSTTDPDATNTFTYTLVTGTGSTDNAAFNISGNQLRATAGLNFEAKSSYSVRVRSTDQGGLFTEKAFTITVTNVNETSTDIALSAASIAENAGANAVVGTLSTTDPDAASTFTYTLVTGTGSTDNAVFNVSEDQLRATASLNFEAKSSYSVRVRSTDQGGLFTEKQFTITVTDVNEPPAVTFGTGAWGWAGAVIPDNTIVKSVASDPAGNVYVAGHFSGNPDFDMGPGTAILSSNAADGFVAKYSSTGVFQWVVQVGGSQEQYPEGITVDSAGNILIAGHFSGAATFGTGLGTNTSASSNGYDGFIFKLNNLGQGQWVKTFTGTNGCYLGSIATDASGAAVAIGSFSDSTVDFDPGAGTANLTASGRNSVIFKLDASGNYAWAGNFAGGSASDVATDSSGNVLVTGIYQYTIDFDPGPGTATLTSGHQAAYAVKLSSSGGYLWAKSLANSDWAHVPHATFDSSGNVFLAGQFTGTVDFDATGAIDSRTAQGSSWDAFATKFSASGDYLWTRQISGAADESIENLAANAAGYVFLAGKFAGQIDADPGTGVVTLTSAGGTDAMLVQLSASGDYRSARRYGGTSGDSAKDVFIDAAGSTLLVGQFNESIVVTTPVEFGPTAGDAALDGGDRPAFVLKLTNHAPFDIALSGTTVAENQPIGTAIGTLSTTDPDVGDTFTYTLVSGTGDADNASFTIVGNTLKTAASFDYETKSSYSVHVRTTDSTGLTFEKIFTITVSDVADEWIIDVPFEHSVTDSVVRSGHFQLVKRGLGTLILNKANSYSGGTIIEAGEVVVRNIAALGTGILDVRAGAKVTMDVGSVNWNGGENFIQLSRLQLDPAGRLEVGTGQIRIASGGYDVALIRAGLIAGRAGGDWQGGASGVGVTSAFAADGLQRAIGYRVMPFTNEMRLGFAAFGDSNLDGRISSIDIALINNGGKFGQPRAATTRWSDGDYNYDGRANSIDIALLNNAGLYGKESYLPPASTSRTMSSATGTISTDLWAAYAIATETELAKKKR